jgi:CHAT domain-containing protein
MSGMPWGNLKAPDEEYLNIAVTRLLPRYYGVPSDAGAGDALQKMADAFVDRHHDAWLRDVLKTPHSPRAAEAFAALGRAAEADATGDPVHAGPQAQAAERLFLGMANEAGTLRSKFEFVYSLQLRGLYHECTLAADSLLAAEKHHYPWLIAGALIESGSCREHSADFESTAARWRDATTLAGQHSYPVLRLRVLGLGAVRSRHVGDIALAWREHAQGLASYWGGSYPLIRAQQFYADLSFLAEDSGLANTSAAMSRENEEITAALALAERQAGALQRLAMSEIATGFPDRAMEHLREAAQLASTFPTAERRRTFTLNTDMDMAALEASRGELDQPLERLTRIQPEAEHADPFLKLRFESELGRLRLRQGQYAEARTLLSDAFMIGDKSRTLTSEAERPLWVRTMADTARALVECATRSGADPQRSWALWAGYRAALFDSRNPSSPSPPVVPAGQAVLSFAELPSGMAAWLGTNEKFLFRMLDVPAQRIREAAGRLTRGCSNEGSSEIVLRADARELSRWLLGPWDHELDGADTVLIDTDDAVSAVPWPALVRANGNYWTKDFAVELRVGSSRPAVSSPHWAAVQGALAVGAPVTGADLALPPLPEARHEAEKVYSLFSRSTLLTGKTATLSQVRAGLSSAHLFHFAGHGYGGEGGGLILGGPAGGTALLRAADIGSLDLSRCSLAVLSGCSTGSGELHGPGDPQSLVRAFLRAGTREVVASYWNLSSVGTFAFMQEFYQAMLNQAPVAQSLRKATAALRSGGVYTHPYYWAGLEVFE